MSAFAVITIKRFDRAKQRLADSVAPDQRQRLAEAMFSDVLEAVKLARMLTGIVVVTGEPKAAGVAAEAGAQVVEDPVDGGHSEAATRGLRRAIDLGADRVILLPGDCPLLDPRELDRLFTGMPSPWVAVVPDRHGTGTNALALAPPDAIIPAFGEGSCERHLGLAREAGIPASREELASLALDLDTPADLVALTGAIETERAAGRKGPARHTGSVLGI
ncbi:MAG: 2-phospho-L-lactate guanylyltransferase [Solirubrobacterales bacterium]|nr:2-phospho-L-lactate guanylyltransferase [Solirubrobacterales bacterium]MCZ2110288.1 2-phospho-L-lactate guanylyltransferase [Dehalococcoidia bacterium]